MTTSTISLSIARNFETFKHPSYSSTLWKFSRSRVISNIPWKRYLAEHCAKVHPWETSSSYAPVEDVVAKPTNMMESIGTEGASELPIMESAVENIEKKKQQSLVHQVLKWPMWLVGPSLLLVTGMAPALWLPLSSVFVGPNTAGVLSLLGLDCIFNMGTTLFLLMADACARPNGTNPTRIIYQIPLMYKFWNVIASVVGFLVPVALYMLSCQGLLDSHLQFTHFAVLLGPYLLLLSVQMLTEMLTWRWKSPVWLVAPVVYEAYRILQLMRGIKLGMEISAPGWAIATLRGLVSWWVLTLGIQIMRVAWFAGYTTRSLEEQ